MTYNNPMKLIALFLLLQATLWGCGGLRTEIYREETFYRYNEACKLYKEGDYEAARSGFEDVIALDDDYGQAHAALGNLALIGEDYLLALVHYQAAVAADPELAAELRPLMMVASAHKGRKPLQKEGVGLDRVFPLMMADRRARVEALLDKDIPLQLLANDTMGITPGQLGELRRKIIEMADPSDGSVRYRLFLGYLLFSGQTDDALAIDMIHSAADEATGKDRQEAFVVLGQLYERQGEVNEAVAAYLAAVDAGRPMRDVAHHLARIYRVDIASVLPCKEESSRERARPVPMHIEIAIRLPASSAPDLSTLAKPKDIPVSGHQISRNAF